MPISVLQSAELKKRLTEAPDQLQLVDVRTPVEFKAEHIAGSVNIPLENISRRSAEISKTATPVMICKSGNRATKAAQELSSRGFDPMILDGGIQGWKAGGNTTVTGKVILPLERQVQLTVGVLLLSSSLLGWL